MEKHYEMPRVQVVRYRKRVKTNTEAEMFTDSSGVQGANYRCQYCHQIVTTLRVDAAMTQDEWKVIMLDAMNAYYGHESGCPQNPAPYPFKPLKPEDFSY